VAVSVQSAHVNTPSKLQMLFSQTCKRRKQVCQKLATLLQHRLCQFICKITWNVWQNNFPGKVRELFPIYL